MTGIGSVSFWVRVSVLALLAGQASGQSITYEYDALDRLVRVEQIGAQPQEIIFSYDAEGNRTAMAVPEPGSALSLGFGLLALWGLARRGRAGSRRRPGATALAGLGFAALMPPSPSDASSPPGFRFLGQTDAIHIAGTRAAATSQPAAPPVVAAATQAGSSTEATPEIQELARALRYDVDLIYEYVYTQIRYEPMWASNKGALGTLLDRSGNDFDQASLMIALLRESGYTASFVYGQLRHQGAELANWLQGPDDVFAFSQYMARTGRDLSPSRNQVFVGSGNSVARADLERVWVKVAIDGTDYVFDPAFKIHEIASGIDLGAAMAYSQPAFLATALAGASQTGDYIHGIDPANLTGALTLYARNLKVELQDDPRLRLRDVIGGSSIEALAGPSRVTSFPHLRQTFAEWPGDIPAAFRSTLRVRHLGIDETFYADSLAGRRLTIFYEPDHPVLRLDGVLVASGSTAPPGSKQQIFLDAATGFASPNLNSRANQVEAGGSFLILNGWSSVGEGRVRHHERREREASFEGGGLLSEPVLGESLAVFAASWLAQATRTCALAEKLAAAYCFHYSFVGVTGQVDNPYLDIFAALDIATDSNTLADRKKVAFAFTGHASALEGGAIEQIQPGEKAVSTIELLGIANETSQRIFDATSSNFPGIQPQLTGYSAADFADVQARVGNGERLILPQNGSLVSDLWSGAGYLAMDSVNLGYVISGGLNGGYGAAPFTLDVETQYQPQPARHKQSFDPVDLVTGDFLLDATDLTVGSQPFPLGLSFQRSYNSGSRFRDGPFGLGWSHGFDLSATLSSDGFQGLGKDSPIDAVASLVSLFVTLDLLSAGASFELQSLEDVVLSSLIQRWFMQQLTNNLVTVSAPGDTSSFVRLPNGNFNPPPGSAAKLSVEPDGSPLLTTKYGAEIHYDLDGRIESWEDRNGNLVTFSYFGDELQSVRDAADHTLSFAWSDGRISSVSDGSRSYSYTYDAAGNLTGVTDANGETTGFEYPSDGLLGEVYTPAHPTNADVSNTYNAQGRVESQLDAEGNLYTYYIAPGVRSEEVDPASVSTVAYYERGKTIREIDGLGFETLSEYDGQERLTRREAPEGDYVVIAYSSGHDPWYERRQPKPGSPLAFITHQRSYDLTFNRITSETDPLSNRTLYFYDSRANLIRVEQPQVGGQTPTTHLSYNARGQVATVTDPLGTVTAHTYDPVTADRLSTTEDVGGLELVTSFSYNAAGDQTSVTDPRGNTVSFRYDAMRRLVETEAPAPFGYLSRFSHDANGQLVAVERQMGNPAPWQTTLTSYTPAGRVATVTEPGAGFPTTVHTYDVRGQLASVTDALGRTTQFEYDARGALERVIDATGSVSEQYTYTPSGKQASVTDAKGWQTQFRYDGHDRLKVTEFPNGSWDRFVEYDKNSNLTSRITRAGETITYAYDAQNRLSFKAVPGQPSLSYGYDLAGRLSDVSDGAGITLYTYDALGRRDTVQDPAGRVVDLDYDAAGNRSRLVYPDGFFVTYEYDEMNRLTVIRNQGTLTSARFGYDSLSRRTSLSRGNSTSTSYGYEVDDDLSSVSHQVGAGFAPSFDYHYDEVHNRTRVDVSNFLYVYGSLGLESATYFTNAMNQYWRVTTGAPMTLSYDLNGNLLTPTQGASHSYDAENRLIESMTPSEVDYAYDAFGIRTRKSVSGVGTHYVLDDDQVIAEYDDGGGLLRRFVYASLDEPIEMQQGGQSWHYHLDGLGSVVALSSASGTVAETYAYGPYGEVEQPSRLGNPYLFAGREYDAETGAYYNRARYYDPVLGRFMQPDPSGYTDGLNLYAYAGGNPINFADPLGLFRAHAAPGRFGQIMEDRAELARRDPFERQAAIERGTGLLAVGASAIATGMILAPEPVSTVGGLTMHGLMGAAAVGAGALDVGVRALPVEGAAGSGIVGSAGGLALSAGAIALPGRMSDALGGLGLAATALSFVPDDPPPTLARPPLSAKTPAARRRELERHRRRP